MLCGTLGAACPESVTVRTAKQTLVSRISKRIKVYLESAEKAVEAIERGQTDDEIHMKTNCGGTMKIHSEPHLPVQRLVLVGHGGKDDVEDALVRLGKLLDFEVVVIDHSPVLSQEPDELIRDADFDLSRFEFQPSDSVVVLTHGERDVDTLTKIARNTLRYVGMLASKQRAAGDIDELKKKGVAETFIESLHTPAGADIGALTPSEIALSIIAEILGTKYGKRLPGKSLKREKQVSAGK